MSSIKDRIFVGGQAPSSDILPWMQDLFTTITDQIDNFAPEIYGSIALSKTPYKPFVVGLIPPDVVVNFIPIERDLSTLATVKGNQAGTANGTSASGGASGPNELVPTKTTFTQKALGNAVYNSLKARGFSDTDARRLTPLFVGQAGAEIARDGQGNFTTTCFNIGNVHSSGPAGGGYYYKGQDFHGSGEGGDPSQVGKAYNTYFVGSPTLQGGVDRWVGATLGWKQVRNANSGADFAAALRPDLFPESRGGNNGPYFTAGKSQDDPLVVGYGRNIQYGANVYSRNNPDPTVPDPNGILSGDPNTVTPANADLTIDTSGVQNQATIMTGGNVTTLEEDDPIGGRTGRNIRPADGIRRQVVDAQVNELKAQVNFAKAVPALYMLVSPQTFTRSYEHSADVPKARRKHIVHMWLEKPMNITCKGVTAAQYIFASDGAGGLSHKYRVHSLAYRNLMSLVRIYKNNGYLYSGGAAGDQNDHIRQIAMSVFIYFDDHVYIGSFDDFSITDSADKPYNLEYNFKFTVRYDMEASSISDADVARSIGGR